MAYLIKVSSLSQHLKGGLRKVGIRACTPTSLIAVHRLLTLSKTPILNDVNKRFIEALSRFDQQEITEQEFSTIKKEVEKFYKDELNGIVARGVHMNHAVRGGFLNLFSRTDANQIEKLAKQHNLRNIVEEQCEISELKATDSLLAFMDPSNPECVALMEVLPPEDCDGELDKPNPLFLPNALEKLLHLSDGENTALTATCVGHTTSIYFLKGYYYFVNSAATKFSAELEVHRDFQSFIKSLIKTWGKSAAKVEFTQYALPEDLQHTDESGDAAELAPSVLVI